MELVHQKPGSLAVPRPIIKLGSKLLTTLVDTGTDVCLVSPNLVKDKAFQEASFPGCGHTTISVAGTPYHLDSPFRVLLEVPEKGTAYVETVYVSPIPTPVDLIMNVGLPFSENMNSLVSGKAATAGPPADLSNSSSPT